MEAPAPRPKKSDRAFCTHSDKTMRGVLRKEMGQSNKYSVMLPEASTKIGLKGKLPLQSLGKRSPPGTRSMPLSPGPVLRNKSLSQA